MFEYNWYLIKDAKGKGIFKVNMGTKPFTYNFEEGVKKHDHQY